MFFCYMPAGFNLTTGKGVFIMSSQKDIFWAAATNTDDAVANVDGAVATELDEEGGQKLSQHQERLKLIRRAYAQARLQPGPFPIF